MKKYQNLLFSLLTIVAAGYSFEAKAECDGFYLAGRGGMAKYKIDGNSSSIANYIIDKDRFMSSGALGYRYKNLRGEFEYVWRRKHTERLINVAEGKFKAESYMFDLYWDFFPYFKFTPFVNAGVGYTRNKLAFATVANEGSFSSKDNNFTWSLGAGISARLTRRWNFDIGYRYYDMGKISEPNYNTDITDHEIYAGFRYVF